MGDLKPYYGTIEKFNEIQEKDSNGLYVITDAGMVFKGDVPVATARNAYFGVCETAASTAVKVCTVLPFPTDGNGAPLVGTMVAVKFSYTNSSSSPKLDVNGLGEASIWFDDGTLSGSSYASRAGVAGRVIYYMWDGTYWVFAGWDYDANTTYSSMTQAQLDAGTSTNGRLVTPKLMGDNFDIDDRTVKVRGKTINVPNELEWEALL